MLIFVSPDLGFFDLSQVLAVPLQGWVQFIGQALGAIASYYSAKRTNKSNESIAARANEFTAEQSATAHQRQVKDLYAAGLNPILSGGGGGASSAVGATQAPTVNEGEAAISSGKAFALLKQTLENQKLEGDKLEAERAAIKQRQMLDATQTQVLAGQRAQAFVDEDYYSSPAGRDLRMIQNARQAVGALGVAAPMINPPRIRDQQGRWTKDGGFYESKKYRKQHGSGRVHSGVRNDPMYDLSR